MHAVSGRRDFPVVFSSSAVLLMSSSIGVFVLRAFGCLVTAVITVQSWCKRVGVQTLSACRTPPLQYYLSAPQPGLLRVADATIIF